MPRPGRELWSYDPRAYADGQPPNGTGFVHRGVAAWRGTGRESGQTRIFMNSRAKLIALDAKTGEPITSFGANGVVDLTQGLRRPVNPKHYTNTSPPVVYRNLVILGNGVGDRLSYKADPPGDVRAFDARTGKQVWRFHTVPEPGEPGHDTWRDGSWKDAGHTNVWAPMSLDEARGLLYLPVSTPGNDFYGAGRPGANIYGESLVCLDAATGRPRWHFQIVHHGLWDYDLASAPNLVTVTVAGRRVDAVVQLTKQGFAFAFDRVTGRPLWPIEERPVPASDIAGEQAWPTQPFPTRPAPLVAQGVSLEDAFDLTPALKAAAQAELQKYRLGPIYTPPSAQGTFMRPGVIGGVNWGGGAFDPESGLLVHEGEQQPAGARPHRRCRAVDHRPARRARSTPSSSAASAVRRSPRRLRPAPIPSARMAPLPILKPPYGELVALNLATRRGGLARAGGRQRRHPQPSRAPWRDAAGAPRRRRRARRHRHQRRPRVRRRWRHRAERVRQEDRRAAAAAGRRPRDDWDADDVPHEIRRSVRRGGDRERRERDARGDE